MNDMQKAGRTRGITLLIIFLAIVVSGFVFSIFHIRGIAETGRKQLSSVLHGKSSVSEAPAAFESYYDALYSAQPWSLDVFSLTQRALCKHETRNFEVLRANNCALYLHGTEGEINVKDLETFADECELLYEAANENGGKFLYVQAPFKNVGQAPELADYSGDITEESESYLDDLIRAKGIPVLDLREFSECTEYYNTDHHWTVGSSFNASRIIGDEIEKTYGIDLKGHDYYGDMNNYDPVTYKDCFLGSIGIKVGPYFGGRDDFTFYDPKFETDLEFEHYIDNKLDFEHSGSFRDTFIDQAILEDSKFYNKFEANMYGAYVESIIHNHKAENDYKALLITHSYGRSMAEYMCLDYSELRYLDPQKGRYNDDLVEYIKEYKPDVVIYMFNDAINVGDGKWTE